MIGFIDSPASCRLAGQLHQTAKLIGARRAQGVARQGFLVSMGGCDTHNEQRGEHAQRLSELATALAAFQRALDALPVADKVTTFTLSDFGRTFRINANAGTDHAWGSPHLVPGGSVRGGAFYGCDPDLGIGGPDDAGDAGAFIPGVATEQYGATLARWFGVPEAALPQVFRNLGAFPTADFGFVGWPGWEMQFHRHKIYGSVAASIIWRQSPKPTHRPHRKYRGCAQNGRIQLSLMCL